MPFSCVSVLRSMLQVFLLGSTVILGIVAGSCALMELLVAPLMTYRYYLPGLAQHRLTDLALAFFYLLCIVVQMANFLASVSLFVGILLIGYNPRWFAFDCFNLLSASLSLALITHRTVTGLDYYQTRVEADIYYRIARVGDYSCNYRTNQCLLSDVYLWHVQSQCCGWNSPRDLLTLMHNPSNKQSNYTSSDITGSTKLLLPNYCCFPVSNSSGHCHLTSPNLFEATCHTNRASLFNLRSVSVVSHPVCLWYSVLKIFTSLAFTFVKKHSFLPQGEGIYSYYLQP